MKLSPFSLAMHVSTSFPLMAFTAFSGFTVSAVNQGQAQGQGSDKGKKNGRRVGKLGNKTSASASKAICGTGVDIQLFEGDALLSFSASGRGCRSGKVFAGSTGDGKKQVTLVPGEIGTSTFAASVTDVETGAVYSISPDGSGEMTVVERYQDDYGEELDPVDSLSPFERKLLDESYLDNSDNIDREVVRLPSGVRGKAVANQFKDFGDRYLTEQQGERDLQVLTEIDILVVWTANAECRHSGYARGCTHTATTEQNVRLLINLAISETNVAFNESGVFIKLNLVSANRVNYSETSTSAFNNALNDITNGKIDNVHGDRTKYGADMVAMIIDDPQYCGMAWLGPNKDYMYSVSGYSCATGYFSFGHEAAHNLGALHDKGTENSCSSNNYNNGYRDPNSQFRTIMSYQCVSGQCDNNVGLSCPRVQRFSNPTYNYNGKAIGSALHDNARQLNRVRDTVAAYYTRPPTNPTTQPTLKPTTPTNPPTLKPTNSPPTHKPTKTPTTRKPTNPPTHKPTRKPTNPPTHKPTRKPTNTPTSKPI